MSASEDLLLAIEYAYLDPENSAELFEALRVFCISAGRQDLARKATDFESLFGQEAIDDSYEIAEDNCRVQNEEVIEAFEEKIEKLKERLDKAKASLKKEKAKAKEKKKAQEKCCANPKVVRSRKTGRRRCKSCDTSWI